MTEAPKRLAIVPAGCALEDVQSYLPSNYSASIDPDNGQILIVGRDSHGWTLEGYVIPRLASALIPAKEVQP